MTEEISVSRFTETQLSQSVSVSQLACIAISASVPCKAGLAVYKLWLPSFSYMVIFVVKETTSRSC